MAAETEIKPTDGLNHVGEKVRVRFQVSNIGAAAKGAEWVVGFRTWKDDGCLIVRVPADVKADFAAQNINSPHHFLNKDVEVTGQIQVISPGGRDCPAIFLKSTEEIRIVEPGASKPVPAEKPQMKLGRSADSVIDIAPKDALQHVGKKVRVTMSVRSIGQAKEGQVLNSEDSYDVPGNLQVLFSSKLMAAYAKNGYGQPGQFYRDREIQVTGVIQVRNPGGVKVAGIDVQAMDDVTCELECLKPSLPVPELVNRTADLYLNDGKRTADVLITAIEIGSTPESLTSLKIEAGRGRGKTIPASAIEDIVVDGIPLDLTWNKETREVAVDESKRLTRRHDALETEKRLSVQGKQRYPVNRDRERETWLQKNRAFANSARDFISDRPFRVSESDYFIVVTDVSEAEGRAYFRYLDQLYDEMCQAFGIPIGRNIFKGKCIICAFERRADFIRFETGFLKKTGGNVHSAGGLCHPNIDGQVVVSLFKNDFEARFAYVLVHETSHAIVSRFLSDARIPSWLNEGMAVWIGAKIVRNDDTLQKSVERSIAALRQQQTLAGFFEADQIEGSLYGTGAAVVDLLINAKPGAFRDFFIDLKSGYSQEEALQRRFDITLDELTTQYARSIGLPSLTR
ncbi:MAG: hypothetical protein KDA81_07410 [Planctomycetaceae bacterium]|nr:hypothetical protein [Planctomycetaceae bacterium]